jgi:hypothetical protein
MMLICIHQGPSLEFFRHDVYQLNLGSGNEQLLGASEERFGHFPIDVGASSLFVLEGIEDAKRRWAKLESEPSGRTQFRCNQGRGRLQEFRNLDFLARPSL